MLRDKILKKSALVLQFFQWLKWSFSSYLRDVELSALGFIALGLRERRAVAVMGFNAPEWFFADLGDTRHLDLHKQEFNKIEFVF